MVNHLQASLSSRMINVSNHRKGLSAQSSTDEGYKSKSSLDSDSDNLYNAVARPLRGPLESAKRRRRSRSVEPVQPQLRRRPASNYIGLSHLGGGGAHMSRSKIRTPMNLVKSNSSDRAYNPITPKVGMNAPLMILRHARAGEKVFSLSGSPVVTTK
jgi:Borealin